MSNLTDLFPPFDTGVPEMLKRIGMDEPAIASWMEGKLYFGGRFPNENPNFFKAFTYDQISEWFRVKHVIECYWTPYGNEYVSITGSKAGKITIGSFNTPHLALIAAFKEAGKIVENGK